MKSLTLLRHAKSGWDDPVEQAATDIGEMDGTVVLVLELDQAAAPTAIAQALPFRVIQLGERLGFPERKVHAAW